MKRWTICESTPVPAFVVCHTLVFSGLCRKGCILVPVMMKRYPTCQQVPSQLYRVVLMLFCWEHRNGDSVQWISGCVVTFFAFQLSLQEQNSHLAFFPLPFFFPSPPLPTKVTELQLAEPEPFRTWFCWLKIINLADFHWRCSQTWDLLG